MEDNDFHGFRKSLDKKVKKLNIKWPSWMGI